MTYLNLIISTDVIRVQRPDLELPNVDSKEKKERRTGFELLKRARVGENWR